MQAKLFRQLDCVLGEGPLWTDKGLVFFNILEAEMHRLSGDGETLDSWKIDRMASAAALTEGPDLLVATETALVLFDPDGQSHSLLVDLEADKPGNRSNDGRADRQGGFWIGTMGKDAEAEAGAIYRFHKGELRCLRKGVTIPNAISFSPDGSTAFFADSALGTIFSWRLGPGGWPIGAPAVFHQMDTPGWAPDGAVIDVFDPEPLPAESVLWHTPNLIVTPHVSADDGDAYVQMTLDLVFRNMRRYLAGEALANAVRPELGY